MFPDAGPTARVLLVLELVQNNPGITAAEVGRRLDISERAARRCVTTLREVGVPVESTRGPHGGYRLGRGLRLPPLIFSATEALGLVMAVLDGNHAVADPAQPVGAALGKLIAALPDTVSRQAAQLRDHAAVAPDRLAARPDPAVASALVEALSEQRRVQITYRTESREWSEEADPWGLVVRYGRWYLICHSHRVDAVRTYRVDRITEVAQTGESFSLPDGFDPVQALEEHLARGWEHSTRVVFQASLEAVRSWIGASMGRLSEHPEGCVLEGSTDNPGMYAAEYLAAIPHDFRVEGGPELRQAMADLSNKLRRSVGSPSAG
ncbi:WYL domain-containing protein [Aestuariimicrobium sp. p3-SID1156]|uniref:helix-turn-helix transcriptional regulator n=1 Tax=Aestuariimicrobium sp. p3-SID1156 TaxID=2916038 RepID=UPI00223A9A90|nr:WYL domain-containing protein [Aestuariimicrobium sp. p3-SID1156]MCT1458359.1 WYL domain-containing protein [Aestuariimicrobium sp. p3-SID1156]